jgi:hypothetical protein
LPIDEGHFAVYQDVAVALRPPDPAPLAAGQVLGDLLGTERQVLVVVDDDVGGRALDERAAVAEAGGNAPSVMNLVCAPPSDTPQSA